MVYQNRKNKIYLALVSFTFIVYTFGQLLSIFTSISFLRLHLLDLSVLLVSFFFILNQKEFTFRLKSVFFVFLFSYLFSFLYLGFHIESLLYFLRFFIYLVFVESLIFYIGKNELLRERMVKIIYISGFVIGLIGLIQYTFLPDLRYLRMIGWDEHYFRLTLPFFDPAYTGIILVINLFFSLNIKKLVLRNFLVLFYLVGIAATFSRSSYLSLLVGFLYLAFRFVKKKYLIAIVFFAVFLIFALPKPGGEGVNLLRINSVLAKAINYNEAFEIIKKYPVFGVGYNNLCFVRDNIFILGNSCFGLDNSFLFIIATTGIIGFFVYIYYLNNIYKNIDVTRMGVITKTLFLVVFVHSLFTNTLFYPWVIVLIGVIVAVSTKKKVFKL